MADPKKLLKAQLREIAWTQGQDVQLRDKIVEVQFNPESLKVNLSNQKAGGEQRGGSATQYVGQGTTKLSFDLWFDVSALPPGTETKNDVRKLTQDVAYFIRPRKTDDDKYIAPGVRFSWGTFWFDGIMESLNETLEFFSEDGRPLRAQLSVSLSQQEIQFNLGTQAAPAVGTTPPGTRPLTTAPEGSSVQSLAGKAGRQDAWQQDALRNGIENPLRLSAGASLDLRPPSVQVGGGTIAVSSPSLGVTAPAVGTARPSVSVASPAVGVRGPSVNLRS
jgi:hypothetical protein